MRQVKRTRTPDGVDLGEVLRLAMRNDIPHASQHSKPGKQGRRIKNLRKPIRKNFLVLLYDVYRWIGCICILEQIGTKQHWHNAASWRTLSRWQTHVWSAADFTLWLMFW